MFFFISFFSFTSLASLEVVIPGMFSGGRETEVGTNPCPTEVVCDKFFWGAVAVVYKNDGQRGECEVTPTQMSHRKGALA